MNIRDRIKWFIILVNLLWAGGGVVRADELTTTGQHRFWVTNRDANHDGVLGEWIMA